MLLLVGILYILFASTFTLGKAAITYMEPIFFIGLRMIIAGSLLLGHQYFFNNNQWRINRNHYFLFAQVSFFSIFFSYMMEFLALDYVASFKVALLFNLSSFITALISYFIFSERLSMKQWSGLFIGFFGILPMIGTVVSSENALLGQTGIISLPEIMLLCAVTSSCYGWTVVKRLVSDHNYSPIMVNGVSMFFGGLLSLALSFVKEGFSVIRVSTQKVSWLSEYIIDPWYCALGMGIFYMMILVIVANMITYNLYGYLLKKYSATFLALAGFITPFLSALFGYFLLNETIEWNFFVSLSIIFCGLYLFYQDELKTGRSKKKDSMKL